MSGTRDNGWQNVLTWDNPLKWTCLDRLYLQHNPKMDEPCWVYCGPKDLGGYGRISGFNQCYMAHRFVYEGLIGLIPAGLQLDHLCRNRSCANPAHLEPVTPVENMRRSSVPKLNWDAVYDIRQSTAPTGELAEKYGVTYQTVWNVRKGNSWNAA